MVSRRQCSPTSDVPLAVRGRPAIVEDLGDRVEEDLPRRSTPSGVRGEAMAGLAQPPRPLEVNLLGGVEGSRDGGRLVGVSLGSRFAHS